MNKACLWIAIVTIPISVALVCIGSAYLLHGRQRPCTVIDKLTGRTYAAISYERGYNHIHFTTPDGKHVFIRGEIIQEFE